jgi:hypothetical protein
MFEVPIEVPCRRTSISSRANRNRSVMGGEFYLVVESHRPRHLCRRRTHSVRKRAALRAPQLRSRRRLHWHLGDQVSLQLLPADHSHSRGSDGWQRRHQCRPDVDPDCDSGHSVEGGAGAQVPLGMEQTGSSCPPLNRYQHGPRFAHCPKCINIFRTKLNLLSVRRMSTSSRQIVTVQPPSRGKNRGLVFLAPLA